MSKEHLTNQAILYLKREKDKRYYVTRWCCNSGNCTTCHDLKQQRIRTVQIATNDLEQAERCKRNCDAMGLEGKVVTRNQSK